MYVNCFYHFNELFCTNGNATYIYISSHMYTKTVLTPTLVSVSYKSTWDPKMCALLSGNFTIGPEDDQLIGRNM